MVVLHLMGGSGARVVARAQPTFSAAVAPKSSRMEVGWWEGAEVKVVVEIRAPFLGGFNREVRDGKRSTSLAREFF